MLPDPGGCPKAPAMPQTPPCTVCPSSSFWSLALLAPKDPPRRPDPSSGRAGLEQNEFRVCDWVSHVCRFLLPCPTIQTRRRPLQVRLPPRRLHGQRRVGDADTRFLSPGSCLPWAEQVSGDRRQLGPVAHMSPQCVLGLEPRPSPCAAAARCVCACLSPVTRQPPSSPRGDPCSLPTLAGTVSAVVFGGGLCPVAQGRPGAAL